MQKELPRAVLFYLVKACGFRKLFSNFFSLREKVAKRGKKRAVLSLCHFCSILKLLSPPRVRFLLTQKLLGTTANFYFCEVFFLISQTYSAPFSFKRTYLIVFSFERAYFMVSHVPPSHFPFHIANTISDLSTIYLFLFCIQPR